MNERNLSPSIDDSSGGLGAGVVSRCKLFQIIRCFVFFLDYKAFDIHTSIYSVSRGVVVV
jgi:hypothetical protein